jgi:hypothetical protein
VYNFTSVPGARERHMVAIIVLILVGALVLLSLTKALLFRCAICRKCTWPWQQCAPARYSDTMDEVHRACVEAARESTAHQPLTRAASV